MTRWATTRAARGAARQQERDVREAERRAFLSANPRHIVETITSRQSVCRRVAAYMLHLGRIGAEGSLRDQAVDHVADQVGVPRDTVLECLSIEALESPE